MGTLLIVVESKVVWSAMIEVTISEFKAKCSALLQGLAIGSNLFSSQDG